MDIVGQRDDDGGGVAAVASFLCSLAHSNIVCCLSTTRPEYQTSQGTNDSTWSRYRCSALDPTVCRTNTSSAREGVNSNGMTA